MAETAGSDMAAASAAEVFALAGDQIDKADADADEALSREAEAARGVN